MKKGGKIPIQYRGEYLKQKRAQDAQQAYLASKKKGIPYFQLYVRPKTAGAWLPFAELAGDNRATAVVNAWLSGFLTDFYRGQMDAAIARSVFTQVDETIKAVRSNVKTMGKIPDSDLAFGYKVDFPGVKEKYGEQKVTMLTPDMATQKGWFDTLKDSVSNVFSFNKSENEEEEVKK